MLMRTMRVADARRIATRTPDFLACARRSFLGTRSELIFSERVDCGLTATWATGAAAGRPGARARAAAGRAGAGALAAALSVYAYDARVSLPALSTARTVSVRPPTGSVIASLR